VSSRCRQERHTKPALDCSITIKAQGIEVNNTITIDDATMNGMELKKLKEVKLEEPWPRRMDRKSKRTQPKDDSRVIAVVTKDESRVIAVVTF
jgi:hypothetical protein